MAVMKGMTSAFDNVIPPEMPLLLPFSEAAAA